MFTQFTRKWLKLGAQDKPNPLCTNYLLERAKYREQLSTISSFIDSQRISKLDTTFFSQTIKNYLQQIANILGRSITVARLVYKNFSVINTLEKFQIQNREENSERTRRVERERETREFKSQKNGNEHPPNSLDIKSRLSLGRSPPSIRSNSTQVG